VECAFRRTAERIIGRTKLSDIELDDAAKPGSAHNVLTTILEDGKQLAILRENMPFGEVGKEEVETYFIGNYDRLLDFSAR
jgi:porphyrinogen peroxidase